LFYPEGKQLVVTGRIIHYTGNSALSGAVGNIISGGEFCVCRVQLTDAESGQQIGEAICWGVIKSAFRRGSEEFGIGVGKGVAGWLSERLPVSVKEKRHEVLGENNKDSDNDGGG
jgi:hypothetical protein